MPLEVDRYEHESRSHCPPAKKTGFLAVLARAEAVQIEDRGQPPGAGADPRNQLCIVTSRGYLNHLFHISTGFGREPYSDVVAGPTVAEDAPASSLPLQ